MTRDQLRQAVQRNPAYAWPVAGGEARVRWDADGRGFLRCQVAGEITGREFPAGPGEWEEHCRQEAYGAMAARLADPEALAAEALGPEAAALVRLVAVRTTTMGRSSPVKGAFSLLLYEVGWEPEDRGPDLPGLLARLDAGELPGRRPGK
jgi:hypothetical protein